MTEVTREVKKCNRITSVIEIVIVSELQEKNVLVKSLVTSHMLHESVHVPYKNVKRIHVLAQGKLLELQSFVHLVKFLTVTTSLIFI